MSSKCLALAFLAAAAVVLFGPSCCYAHETGVYHMHADQMFEYSRDSSWLGMGARVWVYPDWYTTYPDGKHISSIYVHRPLDYRHIEVGVQKRYQLENGDPMPKPRVFYQYNKNPDMPPGPGNPDSVTAIGPEVEPKQYVYFELQNLDVGVPLPRWRAAYNGIPACTVTLNYMTSGDARISSERRYCTDGNDISKSIFDETKVKSLSGWSLWANPRYGTASVPPPATEQDPYYYWDRSSNYHFWTYNP